MIFTSCSMSQAPNSPCAPNSSTKIIPDTTGDTESEDYICGGGGGPDDSNKQRCSEAQLNKAIDQIEKAIGRKEPAGKKLDFLSQEMLREVNTMGSKSRSAVLRTVVVELKTEVERVREQVQNVE